MSLKRKRRVRLHLIDEPGTDLPRIDGLLVSRRNREYLVALPSLMLAADGKPVTPEGHMVAVPSSRVAFYEILN